MLVEGVLVSKGEYVGRIVRVRAARRVVLAWISGRRVGVGPAEVQTILRRHHLR